MRTVAVRLPDNIYRKLVNISSDENKTATDTVREMIYSFVDDRGVPLG